MKRVAVEVLVFVVVAVAVTWATGSLVLISDQASVIGGPQPHPSLSMPAGLALTLLLVGDAGPAIAALVTVAMFDGQVGIRKLLHQFTRWRIAWHWYVVALIGPTAIYLAGVAAFVAAGGRLDPTWIVFQPGRAALTAVGGWGEELGWRGFAQPTLQGRLGAAAAAVVVGVMWNIWHQWELIAPGGARFAWDAEVWSLVFLISVSVLMAWIYNCSRGSLPSAVAAHVGINAVSFNPYPAPFIAAAFALVALVVTIINGPRTLVSRGA